MKKREYPYTRKELETIIKCPVCGKFEAGADSHDICEFCGFEFDLLQIDNPDYPGGANVMSVNQMKKWWNYKTSFNKNFVWTDEDPCGDYRARLFWDTCPICGEKLNVNKLDIDSPDYEGDYDGVRCTKCGWIRDLVQAVEPDMKDGLNKLSVNEYKKEYLSKKGGKD